MHRTVEQEKAKAKVLHRLVEIGFKPTLILLKYDDSNSSEPTGFVCNYDDDLTFDTLEKISKAFETRDINLSCNKADSDHCHDRELTVKGIKLVGKSNPSLGDRLRVKHKSAWVEGKIVRDTPDYWRVEVDTAQVATTTHELTLTVWKTHHFSWQSVD